MKLNKISRFVFIIVLFINYYSYCQAPIIEWQKTFGGSNSDAGLSIIQINNNEYIVAGHTDSNDEIISGNNGTIDCWVVKLNSSGIIRQNLLGGTNIEYSSSIIQANDGGYILSGYTKSNNGDVTGNHGNYDFWIVKLTEGLGIEWQKTLGGTNNDYANKIIQTNDGGYIIAGYTNSYNGNITNSYGNGDYWIVKINSFGNIEWQKTLGGSNFDSASSIIQTNDGGYIIVGITYSNNFNVTNSYGNGDYWIVKINSFGNIEWQKTLGGSGNDYASSIIQTDGGYVVVGHSNSNDGDVIKYYQNEDIWIIKIDFLGNIIWQNAFGGNIYETANSIKKTIDNGYIIAGYTNSNDGDVFTNNGNNDCWIIKINTLGILQWQKTLGGSGNETISDIIKTYDDGYIVVGGTESLDGNITENYGLFDMWVVKLNPENLSNNSFIKTLQLYIFPNPAKENITLKLDYFSPSQEITITDVLGKTIHTQKIEGLSTLINTSSFEKGIYFLNLVDGTQKTTKKFIVE